MLSAEELFKKIREIEIHTDHLANDLFAGQYESAFRGQGVEFAEVRQYYPGDDIRNIDWRVSARAGSLHVKKYVEERELTTMLVVDASASVDFGTASQTKAETMAETAATLAFSAIRNNDKVGAVMFTDTAERFVPPKKGRKQVLRLIRDILYFQPRSNGTDIGEALDYAARVLTRRAVVFVISDFHDTEYLHSFRTAARKHDVIGVEVYDPRERELPPIGLVEMQDAETGRTELVNLTHSALAGEFQAAREDASEQRRSLLNRAGADYIAIEAATSPIRPLMRFFQRRARRR
ncbi:MAG: DUF58 domain-containing protein [Armatimonadota bacterium]